ncbi:hypothetical protein B9479_001161 [Cryptococcus floricola]|uniref:Uncharacterized protein n=1 Tax=Cryptococcus floricola TaxID=2591691 RepID=A0A5D3B6Y7_9TREE|nr:hypothetical protein B9479_001161 [Cryptococcus floricola]
MTLPPKTEDVLAACHRLPSDIQLLIYHQLALSPSFSFILTCRENYERHVCRLYTCVALNAQTAPSFYHAIGGDDDEDDAPVDWREPPELWPMAARKAAFQLNRNVPPPIPSPSFPLLSLPPTARKLLLINLTLDITLVDREALEYTERAAMLYYKQSAYLTLGGDAGNGGYSQEVLFLRCQGIHFGTGVIDQLANGPGGWEEKIWNLAYAFRGPTLVTVAVPDKFEMQKRKKALGLMEGSLKYLGCKLSGYYGTAVKSRCCLDW